MRGCVRPSLGTTTSQSSQEPLELLPCYLGAAPVLSRCWQLPVLSTPKPGAELSLPHSRASLGPTQPSLCHGGRTAPPNHGDTGCDLAKLSSGGDPSPAPDTPHPRVPPSAASRRRGVIGCSSTCCGAALILLQVAAIQCRIYSALTLSCQEGTARLMGWAGSCNNRLFDVTSLIGVDLLTD